MLKSSMIKRKPYHAVSNERAIEGEVRLEEAPATNDSEEIVVTFSPSSEVIDGHRFKSNNQMGVLLMGVFAAAAAVSGLAVIEYLLSLAIELGWLAPPPGPETYGLPV